MIDYNTFLNIDIRVGTITAACDFPEARKPAYKIYIDFGLEIGQKQSSAQITDHYTSVELVGKQVLAVTNFSPKQVGPFMSEVLVLGLVDDAGAVVLVTPDKVVPNGERLQ